MARKAIARRPKRLALARRCGAHLASRTCFSPHIMYFGFVRRRILLANGTLQMEAYSHCSRNVRSFLLSMHTLVHSTLMCSSFAFL